MSFPTTSILDNFNRADQDPLSSSWTNYQGGLKVVSNRCVGKTGLANTDIAYWNSANYADVELYGTVGIKPENDLGTLNLYFRVDTATANGYVLVYNKLTAGDTLVVYKLTGGSPTQILSISQAISLNDVIGISMVGSLITVYRNGSSVGSVSDSTYSAAKRIALGVKYTTTSGAWDDVGGGSPAPNVTITPSALTVTSKAQMCSRCNLKVTATAQTATAYVDDTASPSVLTVTSSAKTATVSGDCNVTPSQQTITSTAKSLQISVDDTASASVVTITSTAQTVTVNTVTDITVNVSLVTITSAVFSPSIIVDESNQTSNLVITATAVSPTLSLDSVKAADLNNLTVTAQTVIVTNNSNYTNQPNALQILSSTLTPSIQTVSNVTINADVVSVVSTTQNISVIADANVSISVAALSIAAAASDATAQITSPDVTVVSSLLSIQSTAYSVLFPILSIEIVGATGSGIRKKKRRKYSFTSEYNVRGKKSYIILFEFEIFGTVKNTLQSQINTIGCISRINKFDVQLNATVAKQFLYQTLLNGSALHRNYFNYYISATRLISDPTEWSFEVSAIKSYPDSKQLELVPDRLNQLEQMYIVSGLSKTTYINESPIQGKRDISPILYALDIS
jgi:hypothetical protein